MGAKLDKPHPSSHQETSAIQQPSSATPVNSNFSAVVHHNSPMNRLLGGFFRPGAVNCTESAK